MGTDGGVFLAYGTPLMEVSLFRYLGRTLLSPDNDWIEVLRNLQREQEKWGWLEKILGREGADRRTVGRFYVAVVHTVLLFGSKMWVLTSLLEKAPKGFHHRLVQQMVRMGPEIQHDGTWVYPLIEAEVAMLGLE